MIRNVRDYHRRHDASWSEALDRAQEAAGGDHDAAGDVVYLPRGDYPINRPLALAGRGGMLQGDGPGTVLRAAPGMVGPVLDFKGYLHSHHALAVRRFSDFVVEGNGEPNPENRGIIMDWCGGLRLQDVTVRRTGGIALDLWSTQECQFSGVGLMTPVAAVAHDVPCLRLRGCANGNHFAGCCVRGLAGAPPVEPNAGPGGAIVLEADEQWDPTDNLFVATRINGLAACNGGCLWRARGGSKNTILGDLWFDSPRQRRTPESPRTVRYRFAPAPGFSSGGNCLRGVIPGSDGSDDDFDFGVEIHGATHEGRTYGTGWLIDGVRGYSKHNVYLGPEAQHCTVRLGGAVGTPGGPAVVDESGNQTNALAEPGEPVPPLVVSFAARDAGGRPIPVVPGAPGGQR